MLRCKYHPIKRVAESNTLKIKRLSLMFLKYAGRMIIWFSFSLNDLNGLSKIWRWLFAVMEANRISVTLKLDHVLCISFEFWSTWPNWVDCTTCTTGEKIKPELEPNNPLAKAYPGFLSMKRLWVLPLPPGWDQTLVFRNDIPGISSGFPDFWLSLIYTPGWREALWE